MLISQQKTEMDEIRKIHNKELDEERLKIYQLTLELSDVKVDLKNCRTSIDHNNESYKIKIEKAELQCHQQVTEDRRVNDAKFDLELHCNFCTEAAQSGMSK